MPSSNLVDGFLLAAAVLLVVATCGAILFALARRYERKRFSDIELARVAFWTLSVLSVFGFGALIENSGGLAVLGLQVAAMAGVWLLWRSVRRAVRRRIVDGAPPPIGALLVLRVFKRPAASEAFMDRLLSCWRFAAPVHLIAGPDLAGATIEPHEFFAFIRRRTVDQFIRDPSEIAARIDRLDAARDPDGRFRVNELFCVERAWRPAVEALMTRAGVVLLDLREYSETRAGTRYELHQVMNLVPPERVLVLVGAGDDASAIALTLRQAWMAMHERSPNRRLRRPTLRVCRLRSESAADVGALFSRMYEMARQPRRAHQARRA
jgi:hypothetical protein